VSASFKMRLTHGECVPASMAITVGGVLLAHRCN
jgi:hypothetical protein